MSALSDVESKLLSHLLSAKGAGRRVELNLHEAAKALGLEFSDAMRALIGLATKGYVRIVKAPATKEVLSYVEGEIKSLDAKFILGELEEREYLKAWEALISIVEDVDLRCAYPPLKRTLMDLLEGVDSALSHLSRLEGISGSIDGRVYELLASEYKRDLMRVLMRVRRYVDSLLLRVQSAKEEAGRLIAELEAVKVDMELRGLDRKNDASRVARRLSELKSEAELILQRATGAELEVIRKIGVLESRVSDLREQHELLKTRAMIEEDPQLASKADELLEKINELRGEIARLRRRSRGVVYKRLNEILARVSEFSGGVDLSDAASALKDIIRGVTRLSREARRLIRMCAVS